MERISGTSKGWAVSCWGDGSRNKIPERVAWVIVGMRWED